LRVEGLRVEDLLILSPMLICTPHAGLFWENVVLFSEVGRPLCGGL